MKPTHRDKEGNLYYKENGSWVKVCCDGVKIKFKSFDDVKKFKIEESPAWGLLL